MTVGKCSRSESYVWENRVTHTRRLVETVQLFYVGCVHSFTHYSWCQKLWACPAIPMYEWTVVLTRMAVHGFPGSDPPLPVGSLNDGSLGSNNLLSPKLGAGNAAEKRLHSMASLRNLYPVYELNFRHLIQQGHLAGNLSLMHHTECKFPCTSFYPQFFFFLKAKNFMWQALASICMFAYLI